MELFSKVSVPFLCIYTDLIGSLVVPGSVALVHFGNCTQTPQMGWSVMFALGTGSHFQCSSWKENSWLQGVIQSSYAPLEEISLKEMESREDSV